MTDLHGAFGSHWPAVNLATWICFVVACLAVLTKIASKVFRGDNAADLRSPQADDYLIFLALVGMHRQTS